MKNTQSETEKALSLLLHGWEQRTFTLCSENLARFWQSIYSTKRETENLKTFMQRYTDHKRNSPVHALPVRWLPFHCHCFHRHLHVLFCCSVSSLQSCSPRSSQIHWKAARMMTCVLQRSFWTFKVLNPWYPILKISLLPTYFRVFVIRAQLRISFRRKANPWPLRVELNNYSKDQDIKMVFRPHVSDLKHFKAKIFNNNWKLICTYNTKAGLW